MQLIIGKAPWWVPDAELAKKSKKKKVSFKNALKDFLKHTSFHGYWKLVEPGQTILERLFWIIFHITALTILIIFLCSTQNKHELLTTTVYNALYPIEKVPVPTISICTINRISNEAAVRYAKELSSKDPLHRGMKFFLQRIQLLYYNYYVNEDVVNFERDLEFQRFLDIFDTNDTEVFFNTKKRMEFLTPSCNTTIIKCRLWGRTINCSDEFETTLTARGFCCTFNNDGRYAIERSFDMRFFGGEQGLVVVLNSSEHDYFYRSSTLDGFVAYIYSHKNYPDISSGAVTERYVQIGVDSYMAIMPKILQTVQDARFLSPKVRNCYFEDEMPRIFGRHYSFNKCITRCRIHSILVLCKCLLFMSPYEYLDASTDTVYCTLQHKECIRRFEFKWLNVITHRKNVHGLEREMEDALYCNDCLPDCSEIRYKTSMVGLPLNMNTRDMEKLPKDNISNFALLRVYFAETHIQYFQQILKHSWFEIFSTIGNICGVITGFSLIGVGEVIFFVIKQIYSAFQEDTNNVSRKNLIILP